MREAPDSPPSTDDPTATQAQALSAHLRAITPQAALASRVLCSAHAQAFLFDLPDMEAWESEVSPVDMEDPGLITLGSLAGPLSLALDLADYPALQILAHGNASSPTGKLRTAIANALLTPLLEQMGAAGIGTWRVTAIERGAGDEPLAHIALTWLGRRHRVGISAPQSTLKVFQERVAALVRDEQDRPEAGFASLPIPGRVTIGRRSLPVAALQKLEPGDILLRVFAPATAKALQSGDSASFDARAAWGTPGMTRAVAAVSIEGSTLTITEEPFMTDELEQADGDQAPFDDDLPDQQDQPEDTYERDETNDNRDDSRAVPIGELELPLQFEIDTVAMPLAQVSALRPGYVIELQAPVRDARIRLVAHGQTIGHGELVALGEHLGIRILRMAHSDGSIQ